MRVWTTPGLAYPITVTKILRSPDDDIEQHTPIFTYRYRAINEEWDEEKGDNEKKLQTYYADFESEIEGKIKSILVKVNEVIDRRTAVAEIEEPCKHEVQFGGMCANCGKDMTTVEYSTTVRNTERATINTVHGHTSLLVSQEEANRADEEAKKRLLESRKLSLVVDLDQTIIHATVDPTVAEWQQDESNPNHEAVKHVRKFQLVDDGPGGRGTWYYIKLRPGLTEFLQSVSQCYELHIYTMATRAYAEEIAKLVDPDRKLFANRILSRDENGSMSSKSLKRLFPVDTKMVVIIDDRGDVWSWSPNLVKVSAYDFFVGIGDINSSFLPKRPELEARPPKHTKTSKASEPSEKAEASASDGTPDGANKNEVAEDSTPVSKPAETNGDVSAVDRMVSMAGNQDDGSMEEKTEEQDKTIAAQLADRPLLQKQKILDAADGEAKTSPAVEAATELLAENGEKKEAEAPRYRHNLLQDDDTELEHLARSLGNIHKAYFDQYDRTASPLLSSASAKGGRVADLRPGNNIKKRLPSQSQDLDNIPDAARIMSNMKSHVLSGLQLVFSGIVPIGVDIQSHDLAIWAKSFGATVSEGITKKTTHVIASPERRTAKVRHAARKGGRIAIVKVEWLFACFSQWKRVDVDQYRIHTEAVGGGNGSALPDGLEGGERGPMLSSTDEDGFGSGDETDAGTDTPASRRTPADGRDTDTEAELERHRPSIQLGDSNISDEEREAQWEDIRDEVDDFLGSEAEESDAETDLDGTRTPQGDLKRKRDALNNDAAEDGDTDGEGQSRLQKRKKEALARTSSLTNVSTATILPTKLSEQTAEDPGGGGLGEDDEDDDLDLEAALAAEMEKQDEEDG